MNEKVRNYIKKYQMIVPGDKVIVGVSGGADSVCLFSMLKEYQKELDFGLVAVHVNHNLRGASAEEDEAYVKMLCEKAGVLLETVSEDVAAYAREHKQSLEEAGREVRTTAFMKIKERYGGTKIATAHHRNDNAETMLMNLARGSGLKGLGGILPVKGDRIRPLLCMERKEIEAYLKEKNISWQIDESNACDDYTRNRIRHHVIPYLEAEINGKCVAHMNETMEQLRGWEEYIAAQMEMLIQKGTRKTGGGILLQSEAFGKEQEVLQTSAIISVLKHVSGQEKDLMAIHGKAVMELFAKQVGRKIDLPYEMQAERTYEGVLIKKETVRKKSGEIEEIRLAIPGRTILSTPSANKFLQVDCAILTEFSLDAIAEKAYTKWMDYDIIENDIVLRSRRPGDFIVISAKGGRQKLKSYFTNEKIPGCMRDEIPLIADRNHILWIVGYRDSSRCHVTEHTKRVLQIQIKEIHPNRDGQMEENVNGREN